MAIPHLIPQAAFFVNRFSEYAFFYESAFFEHMLGGGIIFINAGLDTHHSQVVESKLHNYFHSGGCNSFVPEWFSNKISYFSRFTIDILAWAEADISYMFSFVFNREKSVTGAFPGNGG